jgi:hypothetical protein
MKEKLLKPV